MKVKMGFKTPDAVYEASREIEDEDEKAKFEGICKKFIKWGECVVVEVDTDKGTCEVVPT